MSKMTVDTVQAALNKKAEERLDKDLEKICNFVRENPILSATSTDLMPTLRLLVTPEVPAKDGQPFESAKWKDMTPFWIFEYVKRGASYSSSLFMDRLREKLLPTYIEQETNAFFQRVQVLEAEVQDLIEFKNSQSND